MLAGYDEIFVCVSGGKDSQVSLGLVCAQAEREHCLDRVTAVHADTGSEWPQTLVHCQYLATSYDVPLLVVRPPRPLAESIRRRGRWPSASCRYCTSDHKRDPIARLVRERWPAGTASRLLIVSGERREESPRRARLSEFEPAVRLTAGRRQVWAWRPVLDFSADQIWQEIKGSGLRHHVAYDLGASRVSCSICILASEQDVRVGARHNPRLAEEYLAIEAEIGHRFRAGRSLGEILDVSIWVPGRERCAEIAPTLHRCNCGATTTVG